MENTPTLPVFDITAPYHIKREYYRDGFTAFQKKFVMKRNYVMMALFFVLLVSFVVSAVADPSNKTAYFLMMICLGDLYAVVQPAETASHGAGRGAGTGIRTVHRLQ